MILSNNWQTELSNKPTFKFRPVKNEMKNEYDNSIVSELENNQLLKNNVMLWNQQGGNLHLKIDVTENEIPNLIVEIEKTLNVKHYDTI